MRVSFTTYPEVAANIVSGDIVELNLTTPLDFQDPDETGVLRYKNAGSGILPVGKGIVQEANLNPSSWTVSMLVLLPIKLGEG